MTRNTEIDATRSYHNLTKHSYWSIRTSPHYLDWANQPSPFKIYPSLEPMPLPTEFAWSGARALEVIAAPTTPPSGEQEPSLEQLASLLLYSAGVTKEKKYPGGSIYFRAAACAGALYPTETYVICGDIEGLRAGVYHFNPGDFSLRQLREGDHRDVLAHATASQPEMIEAPVVLVYSAISFRSTWKYRDRAYRYHFWDNGMILENALAMASAHQVPATVILGFVEAELNRLIGIDGQGELALSLLALGHTGTAAPKPRSATDLPELKPEVIPLSRAPVDYASVREMHDASSLTDPGEVDSWRPTAVGSKTASAEGEVIPLSTLSERDRPQASIEEVIERRGSTRRFARKPISRAHLSTILEQATRTIPLDCLAAGEQLNDLYLIVNRVEGLEPGGYYYRRNERALELLKAGDFSEKAAYLTLEQPLGGDASATIFFMVDLERVLARWGNRGYRVAQMEAGIIGGRVYLAAYALGRGATGLTFYDDEVTEFFSPHGAGKSCMLVVSMGVPGKRLNY